MPRIHILILSDIQCVTKKPDILLDKKKVITLITIRVSIKSDALLFSAEDYSYIMQCRDIKPRYKILKELLDKYKTSSKRIYQIWRGEEFSGINLYLIHIIHKVHKYSLIYPAMK